ncbi:LysE family translocator [Roseibium polysiphoniae]|uniref:LysE family translocator n=1 Tax=Roseibium polysiphoniae TaxID=2571221 RepID=A0ABR9CCP7_9HYPH|nr:LysE family translocator [Roseibium polysiphoniae]MBD8877324.1 LysE family translocator [Roseibium polysiphoniae]
METINYPLIFSVALLALATPGSATLAIAGTSMALGRKHGMALAFGVLCGSLTWSITAALGLGTLMLANAWVLEVIRYVGAGYLIFLALKSARAAFSPAEKQVSPIQVHSGSSAFRKGYALHLTNPKAILFFGSLYSVGVPPNSSFAELLPVIVMIGMMSTTVFLGYGWLFAVPALRNGYARLHRWFNGLFAIVFGGVGLRLLTARMI